MMNNPCAQDAENRVFNSRASAEKSVIYGKKIEKLTPGIIRAIEILTGSENDQEQYVLVLSGTKKRSTELYFFFQ